MIRILIVICTLIYSIADIPAMEQKLLSTDIADWDRFGFSVAVSGDVAVIGAPQDDDVNFDSGAAYIFKNEGGTWTEQQKLTASDGSVADNLGRSVAVSGETTIIGAKAAAYIFKRQGGIWAEQAKLTAADALDNYAFGLSVAISGDYAAVGNYYDDDNGIGAGAVYIYKQEGGVWTGPVKLTPSDAVESARFGRAVAASGNYLVVGAPQDQTNNNKKLMPGSAYVFKLENGTWIEQAKLTASDGKHQDHFGYSVAVSGDFAVIGAPKDTDHGPGSGSVYIFKLNAGVWTEQTKLTAPDGEYFDGFGYDVGISGDYTVVGAPGDDDNGLGSGSVYVYEQAGGEWKAHGRLTGSDNKAQDDFGGSVSVSGNTAVAGADGKANDATGGGGAGAAYLYELNNGNSIPGKCPVTIHPDLSFELANTAFQSLSGNQTLSLEFEYAGAQNGDMLWELTAVEARDLTSCPIPLTPDLAVNLAHVTFQSPSGDVNIWVNFEFYDIQDDQFLWKLVDLGMQ